LREDSSADPDQLPDTYLERARSEEQLGMWTQAEQDYTRALDGFEELGEDPNAFTLNSRGNCRRRRGDFAGAAEDHLGARAGFAAAGDGARALIALSDAALELYGGGGGGGEGAALEAWAALVHEVTAPVSRDLGLLKQLAIRESEAHIALAAHYWDKNEKALAETEWNQGCLRLDAILADEAFGRKIPNTDLFGVPVDRVDSCRKFQDPEWVRKRRFWPENLGEKLQNFVRSSTTTRGGGKEIREGK